MTTAAAVGPDDDPLNRLTGRLTLLVDSCQLALGPGLLPLNEDQVRDLYMTHRPPLLWEGDQA